MSFRTALMVLPLLSAALTVHEFAHAWSAYLLGDGLARRQGRMSLNPFRHMTVLGTLAIFLLPIGWARPVPINLYHFKRPRRDYLLSSLAGPAANAVVAGLCLLALRFVSPAAEAGHAPAILAWCDLLLRLFALVNAALAALNLIPIPPLDGSKIWPVLIPWVYPGFGKRLMTVSMLVLAALVMTGTMDPVIRFVVDRVDAWMPQAHGPAPTSADEIASAQRALDEGRYPAAEKACSRAIELNPRSARAYRLRAVVRARMHKLSEAVADAERADELDGLRAPTGEVLPSGEP